MGGVGEGASPDGAPPERALLAVDLGLRTGLALFGGDGRLRWARSQNLGSNARLKRAVYGLLGEHPEVAAVVVEGGGPLATIWQREAERRGLAFEAVGADRWRADLLYPRERRSGEVAKASADGLARRVFAWSALGNPTALRHDAAEAVLVGLWACVRYGWLEGIPEAVRRG